MQRPLSIFFTPVAFLTLAAGAMNASAAPLAFDSRQLSDEFWSEGAAAADFTGNDHTDIASGPWIWHGPDFVEKTAFYKPKAHPIDSYANENFMCFAGDINGNGRPDIVVVGIPGDKAWWFENPGETGDHWQQHVAFNHVDNESPTFTDITGNGRPELVFSHNGTFGYATYDPDNPGELWTFHPISAEGATGGRFTHGLGVGDIDGDGRPDLVAKNGWWQQPESLENNPEWEFHPFNFTDKGGAQMLVADFDGDGLADIITSLDAHAYGLALFRQTTAEDNSITFEKQLIMGESPEDNPHGVAFSQLHALALADFTGNDVPDFVTGKRFWAHNGRDPGANDPAVLYVFETIRKDDGSVDFLPHLVDDDSGVGVEVLATDLNGNGKTDIVTGNKKGVFLHLQSTPNAPEE